MCKGCIPSLQWEISPLTGVAAAVRAWCVGCVAVLTVLLAGTTSADALSWTIRPLRAPLGSSFSAISCSSESACTAVGALSDGPQLVERWNGSSWVRERTPNEARTNLDGVACPGARLCWVVGSILNEASGHYRAVAERWNGGKWSLVDIPAPSPSSRGSDTSLDSISCSSPDACTAIGENIVDGSGNVTPLVERWNGRSWSIQRAAPGDDDTWWISCHSNRVCVAVGTPGEMGQTLSAMHWTNNRWMDDDIRFAASIASISCGSNRSCLSAGDGAFYWNGKRWTHGRSPGLNDIACISARDCIGVGASGISRWDGRNWSYELRLPRNSPDDFESISCSATACIALGIEYINADGAPKPIFAQSQSGPSFTGAADR
jgi:hypothetical protein